MAQPRVAPLNQARTPAVVVSVVTYNNAGCLPEFLASLEAQAGVEWTARFFDSGSSDGTVDILERSGLGAVHASSTNRGYAFGHNFNLSHADAEYFLVLNADLVFGQDTIARLKDELDRNPQQAIAGPSVVEGDRKSAFPPRRFYPGEGMLPLERGSHKRDIAWLNGCCMLIRRSALEDVRGFDEDFFLYQAETDLCLRLRRRGHRLGVRSDVVVRHLHRQSQRQSTEYQYARRIFEGSAVFWKKHYSPREVQAMARFQRAVCNVLLSSPLSHFRRLDNRMSADRIAARRDVCESLIREDSRAGMTRILSRILPRQSRLIAEWIVRRRFPLDDY